LQLAAITHIACSGERMTAKRNTAVAIAVGQRIRSRRSFLRLSQADVARAIGTDRHHISHIESGNKLPDIGTLYRIAEALECEAFQLMPLSGEI
jgi:transcriptional regulator with XRE-family HTH domain